MQVFLKKHLWKIFAWITIILTVICAIMNFEIIQNPKLIEESWMNLIKGYILIILMIASIIIVILFLFAIYKEIATDTERFLLKNLTTACFLLVLMLWFYWIEWGLDKEFTLTAVGAIIVFWYWYKKYERDKEIELIRNFSERYRQEITKAELWEYVWITDLWYEEYFLYNSWYISELLWKEWDYWIYKDLQSFLWKDYEYFANWKKELFFYSLMPLHQLGLSNKNQQNMIWNGFSKYIFRKIEKAISQDRWLMEKIYEWDQDKINSILEWQKWIKRITKILIK